MLKEKKEQRYEFTILYFIGIIMVIAIHRNLLSAVFFYKWFDPTAFVLTLFAFASGYFFTKNIDRKPTTIIWNKLKKLIIPLYCWNLIYGILVFFLNNIGLIQYGGQLSFKNLIFAPIYSTYPFQFNLGCWFIVSLFFVQMFSILFLPILKKKNGSYFVFILYLLLGMLGVQLSIMGYNVSVGLRLTRMLYFLPFFALGILYKEKLEKYDTVPNSIYFTVVIILQLFFIFLNGGMPNYVPADCSGFENIFYPFIFGFLGLAFWFRISKILVPVLKNSKIVNIVSNNTFSIMMHHLFSFFVLNLFWFVISTYIFGLDNFNFKMFQENMWYVYLPKKLQPFKILYLFFGIGFPLIISFTQNKLLLLFSKNIQKYRKFRLNKRNS